MRHSLKLRDYQITKSRIRQRGYIMITLMLLLAMISLALLAVLPDIGQQIRRDREDELTHRGTAYMRAIQRFYKKFGRYPTRIEELENTNNLRFLRKRYTDPVNVDPKTGKERDFKFLHQQDIALNNGPVLGQTQGQGGLGQQGGIGQQGGFGQQSGIGQQDGLGGTQGGFGGPPGGLPQSGAGAQTLTGPNSGDSASDASSAVASSSGSEDDDGNPKPIGSSPTSSGSGPNGQMFGGGPILGVASASKAKSIHVYYKKDHYNDWLFIYMPSVDRGGLLTGPINPNPSTASAVGGPGQPIGGATGGAGQGLTPAGGQTQVQPTPQNQGLGQMPEQ